MASRSEGLGMNDRLILGTVAIVGVVAVTVVALVYNRPFSLKGGQDSIEIQTNDHQGEQQPPQ